MKGMSRAVRVVASEVLEEFPMFGLQLRTIVVHVRIRILVKVRRVVLGAEAGDHRGLHLAVVRSVPVDGSEPFVLLHVLCRVFQTTVSLRAIGSEKLSDKVLCMGFEMSRKFNSPSKDFLINAKRILVVERWIAGKHFVYEYPQSPPIYSFAVAFALYYFWCEIFWCTAQSPCSVLNLLREAKIGYFDVPVTINEQIFGFQIAVNDVLLVQTLDGQHNLRGKEARRLVCESATLTQL